MLFHSKMAQGKFYQVEANGREEDCTNRMWCPRCCQNQKGIGKTGEVGGDVKDDT